MATMNYVENLVDRNIDKLVDKLTYLFFCGNNSGNDCIYERFVDAAKGIYKRVAPRYVRTQFGGHEWGKRPNEDFASFWNIAEDKVLLSFILEHVTEDEIVKNVLEFSLKEFLRLSLEQMKLLVSLKYATPRHISEYPVDYLKYTEEMVDLFCEEIPDVQDAVYRPHGSPYRCDITYIYDVCVELTPEFLEPAFRKTHYRDLVYFVNKIHYVMKSSAPELAPWAFVFIDSSWDSKKIEPNPCAINIIHMDEFDFNEKASLIRYSCMTGRKLDREEARIRIIQRECIRESVQNEYINTIIDAVKSGIISYERAREGIAILSPNVLAEAIETWMSTFGRIPKDNAVLSIHPKIVPHLKDVWKYFQRIIKRYVGREEDGGFVHHDVIAAANVAITFKDKYEEVIKLIGNLHDTGINLRPPYSKEVSDLIWKYRHVDYAGVVNVANSWNAVTMLGGHSGMKLNDLKVLLRSLRYIDVRDTDLAQECARWGISQSQFDSIQSEWLDRKIPYESIPRIDITCGDFRMYKLDRNDPRGLFLGNYTDCCQHVNGAGSTCAIHGVSNPDGGFFVVEYRGQIIAQSWTWRRDNVVVFDNIEALGSAHKEQILELYTQTANELIGRLGIEQVNVGTGYSDIDLRGYEQCNPATPPAGCYTDARIGQVILAKKEVK